MKNFTAKITFETRSNFDLDKEKRRNDISYFNDILDILLCLKLPEIPYYQKGKGYSFIIIQAAICFNNILFCGFCMKYWKSFVSVKLCKSFKTRLRFHYTYISSDFLSTCTFLYG